MLFLTKKQLERIMNEQRNIVKNLPDGLIISKRVRDPNEQNSSINFS